MDENMCTINGITYEAIDTQFPDGCEGCVACQSQALCYALPVCWKEHRLDNREVVWGIKEGKE